MALYHDGFYTSHEDVADAVGRYLEDGWIIIAVLPPAQNDSLFSILALHATKTQPSWEEVC